MHFKQAYDPIRALGGAWEVIKKAPATMLIGGALLWITEFGQGAGLQLDGGLHDFEDLPALADQVATAVLASVATFFFMAACCFGILVWLFQGLLLVGYGRCVERAVRGEPESLAELFKGNGLWGHMLLVRVLKFVLLIAAMLPLVLVVAVPLVLAAAADAPEAITGFVVIVCGLAYLPVIIYVGLGLSLAPCAVAIEGMSATEAISRSWTLARGHRLQLFVYFFALFLLEVLCCCTLFLSTTVVTGAYYESYVQLVRGKEFASPPVHAAPAA